MKLFVITLAYIITYVTACGTPKTTEEMTALKCNADIAFRGSFSSGTSSTFSVGPENYSFRRDYFTLITDFKGNMGADVTSVFGIYPAEGPCSNNPIDDSDALVFAKLNTTYNMYEIFPCSYNPAASCVDLTAFDNIVC